MKLMTDIVKRAVWGTLFVTVITASFFIGGFLPIVVLFCFMLLGINEFYRLFNHSKNISSFSILGITGAVLLFAGLYLHSKNYIDTNIGFLLIPFFLPLSYLVFSLSKNPLIEVALTYLSWIYITIPFFIMYKIFDFESANKYQWTFIIGFFILIWSNDTFAYLIGRKFGKNKLIERISPKKTWEGVIGGFIATILFGIIYSLLTNNDYMFWLVAAILISPIAIIGDLLESKLKRLENVKDSGNILPGHGGILDRFDAAIYAAPFFYLLLLIFYI